MYPLLATNETKPKRVKCQTELPGHREVYVGRAGVEAAAASNTASQLARNSSEPRKVGLLYTSQHRCLVAAHNKSSRMNVSDHITVIRVVRLPEAGNIPLE